MKEIILGVVVGIFAGCASLNPKSEDLKQEASCKVWTKNAIGINQAADIDSKNMVSRRKMHCWVWNMYLCSYNKYSFDQSNKSVIKHNLLGNAGTLNGKQMKFKLTGLESQVFTIENNLINYTYQGPIGGPATKQVEYNNKCSTEEVALGIMALVGV